MKRTSEDIALDAVYEAMGILAMLADEAGQVWMTGSVFRQNLDRLARELDYPDAAALAASVDADRRQDDEMWRGVYDCKG